MRLSLSRDSICRVPPLLVLLVSSVGFSLSCGDGPVEIPSDLAEVLAEAAADKNGNKPGSDDDALSIEDMLADPLFQVVVLEIREPSVSETLSSALEALLDGKAGRAKNLIEKAAAEVTALEDQSEVSIHWSVLERFFEEAELI